MILPLFFASYMKNACPKSGVLLHMIFIASLFESTVQSLPSPQKIH
jgi:hypothetical protein